MSTQLLLTVDRYAQMIESGAFVGLDHKIELIDGEIRKMVAAGPTHCDYINEVAEWSVEMTKPAGMKAQIQSDIILSDMTQPVPDVVWINRRRYLRRLPTPADIRLVIEVSDDSLRYDLGEKADKYADSGIVEYWVVDVEHQCVHRMTDPVGGVYSTRRRFEAPDRPSPLCLPTAGLDLEELFIADP